MKKLSGAIIFAIALTLVLPQVASAVWWNPRTWPVFRRTEVTITSNAASSTPPAAATTTNLSTTAKPQGSKKPPTKTTPAPRMAALPLMQPNPGIDPADPVGKHPDWKTVTTPYGFSFRYPPTWGFNPQDDKTYNLQSNSWTDKGPTVTLSFRIIDDPTYYEGGNLKYDPDRKGFLDISVEPNKCLVQKNTMGAYKATYVAKPVSTIYQARTASSASATSVIITNKSYVVYVTEHSTTPSAQDIADVSDVYAYIRFHTGVQWITSPCVDAQDEFVPVPTKISDEGPLRITTPVTGTTWHAGATYRIDWKAKDYVRGNVAIYLSSSTNGWSCLLGTANAAAGSMTMLIPQNLHCPDRTSWLLEPGTYYLSIQYPYNSYDPYAVQPGGGTYGDGSGYFVKIELLQN